MRAALDAVSGLGRCAVFLVPQQDKLDLSVDSPQLGVKLGKSIMEDVNIWPQKSM